MKNHTLISFTLAFTFTALSTLSSQVVYTNPVGAVRHEIPAGISLLSAPLLKEILFQGVVTASDGALIQVNAEPGLNGLPCYVHVLSGDATGEVETIVSQDGAFLELDRSISGLVAGDSVAIRRHTTLGGFFADANLSDDSVVTVYNLDGTTDSLTFYEGYGWFDQGFAPADDFIIFPGEGIAINANAPTEMTFLGDVSISQVNRGFTAGQINIVGSLNPAVPVTIGPLFDGRLSGDSTLTIYVNEEGVFQKLLGVTYYEGYGFFDDSFADANTENIFPIESAVLLPTNSGVLRLPAAYSEPVPE